MRQRQKKRQSRVSVFLGVFVLSFVSLWGCTHRGEDSHLKVYHGYEKDDVKSWDPVSAYDSISLNLVPNIYETLYQYDYLASTYTLVPLLAADMPQFSKDKLTVTIPIRKGIRFQDSKVFNESNGKGRELKAQDFVYGIKRLAHPALQSQGWWVIDGKIKGINEFHDRLVKASGNSGNKEELKEVFLSTSIEGLKALDDSTLQIQLTKPYPALMYVLAMTFTAPVPHEAVSRAGDKNGNIHDTPVGTGPFVLTQWRRNHSIQLDKNPNYRGDAYPTTNASEFRKTGMLADAGKPMPFLDRLSISITKEDQPRWLNFLKGNTDAIKLPKDNFNQAITNQVNLSPEFVKKGIRLNIESGVVVRYISFNMRDELIGKNQKLRQALSSAIDREKWISIFTNGTGRKMVNAIPPGILDRPKVVKNSLRYDFDLEKAKRLLKEAGYPEGKGLPRIKFDLRGASTTDRQLGEFVSQQFAQIGVQTDVISNTFPAFLEKMKQGDLQVSSGGWSMDYPDAENIYQLFYGPNQSPGPNDSNYDRKEYNTLYDKMVILEPGTKRAEIIESMDAMLQEDCPLAMGYYESEYDLSQPWLLNYRANKVIQNKHKYFKIDSEVKKRYIESSL